MIMVATHFFLFDDVLAGYLNKRLGNTFVEFRLRFLLAMSGLCWIGLSIVLVVIILSPLIGTLASVYILVEDNKLTSIVFALCLLLRFFVLLGYCSWERLNKESM